MSREKRVSDAFIYRYNTGRAVNQRINQSCHELINVVRAYILRCRQKGSSDRCELICRVSRRDRPGESISSLSPSNTGIKDEQLRKRSAVETSLHLSLLHLSRRMNSRKYMWLT